MIKKSMTLILTQMFVSFVVNLERMERFAVTVATQNAAAGTLLTTINVGLQYICRPVFMFYFRPHMTHVFIFF